MIKYEFLCHYTTAFLPSIGIRNLNLGQLFFARAYSSTHPERRRGQNYCSFSRGRMLHFIWLFIRIYAAEIFQERL